MRSQRAGFVLGIGIVAYTLAVLQRTSLSVAGLDAAARFHTSASIVATFVVLQLLVYAGMQVPAGILLDRFGTRLTVCVGAAIMAVGQVLMAFADTVPLAMFARVLVGTGDAMTFASVLRLIPAWFPARRIPVLTQITPLIGQSGQILATAPLAAALHDQGWTAAFAGLAVLSLVSSAIAGGFIRNQPADVPVVRSATSLRTVHHEVLGVLREPGTSLGLWTHFTSGFAPIVFSMLWGFPWLTQGEGLSRGAASTLITVFVVAGMLCGPGIGMLVQRFPLRRSSLALVIIAGNVVMWSIVLLWPGPAPVALLVVLMVVLSAGGPGSNIGFDFARSFNHPSRLGTATGIVIMGGFFAALLDIFVVGLVLDTLHPDGKFDLVGFRIAMATQLPVWLGGAAMILHSRRRVRRVTGVIPDSLPSAVRRKLHPPGT